MMVWHISMQSRCRTDDLLPLLMGVNCDPQRIQVQSPIEPLGNGAVWVHERQPSLFDGAGQFHIEFAHLVGAWVHACVLDGIAIERIGGDADEDGGFGLPGSPSPLEALPCWIHLVMMVGLIGGSWTILQTPAGI